MVTKERLEELIKQDDKKIYWLSKGNSSSAVSVIKEYNNLREFASLILESIDNIEESVFETKEEAEEYLEFDTTQKSETLLMCDWNVAKDKKCGYCADFWVDGSNYSMLISGDIIYIQEEYYSNEKWNKDILFKESLNRENYDKARRLCRKLFLGEENDK